MRSTRQQAVRRSLGWLGGFALALLPVILLPASPAWAEGPERVVITGDDLAEPIELSATDVPQMVAALDSEINWLVGRPGNAKEPDDDANLGPAYVLETYEDGEARRRYVLYPLADGGPRVFRPAEQPGDRKTSEAWFFGRLSMPSTLSAAGVPLEGVPPRLPGGGLVPGGGVGGGNGSDHDPAPSDEAGLLETWREGMQLTILVAVAIAAGLAAVALLIRRKV